MSTFETLLGTSTLLKGKDSVKLADALGSKDYLGLYFSAHWCPPCRQFTPKLVEFYKTHAAAKNLEIVFLSSDRDQESYNEYYGEMPWLALPFSDAQIKATLSKKYKVQGIPTLVLVDKNGQTITTDARGRVMTDSTAQKFPWRPPTVNDVLGKAKLINSKQETVTWESLKEKEAVGLYFSAQWCGPCRAFTPKLKEVYSKLGGKFEVLFVSGDHTEDKFEQYFGAMPWTAIPFDNEDTRMELNELYEVEGFPTLIIIDPKTGKVINAEGRAAVAQDETGAKFPWKPEAYQPLGSNRLNTDPCFSVLYGSQPDQKLNAEIKAVAEKFAKKFEESNLTAPPVYFFYGEGTQVETQVRKVLQLPEQKPLMLVMSIPDQAKYISPLTTITATDAEKFIQDFIDGKLTPTPLGQ